MAAHRQHHPLLSILAGVAIASLLASGWTVANATSFYDLSAIDIHGVNFEMSKLRGTVSLVVNVASFCGLTNRTYTELVQLSERFKGRNFNILAFPCNQFNSQEPNTNQEIEEFAKERFGADFLMFAKTTVNEPMCPASVSAEADVCSALSTACCPTNNKIYLYLKSVFPGNIEWNFAKFLVDRNGKVIRRYLPWTFPHSLVGTIEVQLAEDAAVSST
eukprot:TRINITY_DN89_c0_g2_i1.p1 TRINITY_DN89_c0_g2~~TRINITY_DN89_c0_g2_i1.p1  ORF type:complete len:218 (+),score=52.47 TRINITY_DN89_c0_g2_i1:110-763(+)